MKIAVFYYTQTGQALEAIKSIFASLEDDMQVEIVYKQIVLDYQFPFPWNKYEFFDVFPETRLGITLFPIRQFDYTDIADANLVVVVGQPWFLSPSQAIQSFFTDEAVCQYLRGRDVLFVNVCRNMWLMTYQKVKAYIRQAQARMVGHIVLQDRHANLVSVLTIVRWLLFGKKQASKMLPAAGVSKEDLSSASRFGKIIFKALKNQQLDRLQFELYESGAIKYKSSILFLEKTGHRIFGFWAKFIRKKGCFGDVHRHTRINMFFYYLLFVLFVVSPFAQVFFYLTYPFRRVKCQEWNVCHLKD